MSHYNRYVAIITDTDEHASAGYPLLPWETLLYVQHHTARAIPNEQPSSLREILRLTHAKTPEEIGQTGPSIAALAYDSAEHTPDHLKLYNVVFGRDSLRVAIDLMSNYPELARATILELAHLQGLEDNPGREEELGRIVHEARSVDDPIAVQLTERKGWQWPYYGSVDATPEFIRTLTAYCQRSEENRAFLGQKYTDMHGNEQTISHALELALLWIERRLSSNEQGILEYKSTIPFGIENQVWKDSWDAYHHADGSVANHQRGVSSIEVQVTTYDALIDAAELFEDILDSPARAKELRHKAEALKAAILDIYWTEDKGGYFVLGTDRSPENGNIRQLKVRTSNMGHVLNSRLLLGDDPDMKRRVQAVVQHLHSPAMLNVSGIRTLASDETRFRAGAYHNGSVWLWDTHHIAKGLRRMGYTDFADDLDQRILHAVAITRIFPEYVRGDDSFIPSINTESVIVYDKVADRENQVEQPPQEVQAWTVAAILATKRRLARRTY